ncbi:MAG: serine/threonine protein kinase [Cyanomargarita calcarea GSE-NOS-MK-12-04C]|uniref:Serine/threonine protein kinase n=1 Tax=Cyanomargarita calcarea GSE-NOS-MK-12-04C TaxID=2839659 RepID=A0A951QPD4_9CYAN|nr:serine/threonine protein kinase [Cyanomargarita calcarea GSE-NOS-MK-12-04C]
MVMQKTELDVNIGKFLNNRYLIRDLIGKGGMGRVYLAEDTAKGGMPVAVKMLSLSIANQQMSQRFGREIFIGAQLGRKSQHIVRVLSYGLTDDQVPFYVMEYLQGKNLKQIITSQPLTISKFLDFTLQICSGLECAHQGVSVKGEIYPVVHRDIKPENIFIAEDTKKGEIVKILDFGIAKFFTERSGMTLTDSFIGSLPYCSPEHMEGRKLMDVRSDIYSLGILMFEMLTGKNPFQIKSHSFGNWYQAHRFQEPIPFEEVIPDVKIPSVLKKMVLSCLAKEVSDRPQSIDEILEYLNIIKNNSDEDNSIINNSHKQATALQLIPLTGLSEKECLQKTWPKNKPIAAIGFPHLLHTPQGTVATFWAMLPKQEITQFLDKNNSTEFISKMNVYPMLFWITVLHDGDLALTRWLSYFLDLKDIRGQRIVRILADTGYYHLLFFALEEPTHCTHVKTLTLTANQRQQLADCLDKSENSNVFITSNQAKRILKAEFEKLKPEILLLLEKTHKKCSSSVKTLIHKFFDKFLNLLSRD